MSDTNVCNNLSYPVNDEKFPVIVDRVYLKKSKPPDQPKKEKEDEWKRIYNSIRTKKIEYLSPKELSEAVLIGTTFCPGVFQNQSKTNDNWIFQQYFALDIEKSLTINQFLEICREYKINPCFMYTTFNHTQEAHRFRAVFLHDQLVTDLRVTKMIIHLLFMIFNTGSNKSAADENCKDICRMYLGTNKELVYENFNAKINVVDLFEKYKNHLKSKDPKNYSKNLIPMLNRLNLCDANLNILEKKKLKKMFLSNDSLNNDHCNLDPLNHLIDNSITKNSKKNVLTYFSYYIIEEYVETYLNGPKVPIFFENEIYLINFIRNPLKINNQNENKYRENKKIINSILPSLKKDSETIQISNQKRPLTESDKKLLFSKCQLIRKFISGEEYIHYGDRFLIATNLYQLRGGLKWFESGFEKRSDYDQDRIVYNLKNRNYKPQSCNGCSFADRCDHKINILNQLPSKRLSCRQVKESNIGEPLEITRSKLRSKIREIIDSPEKKVFVIKCDTGVGKTEEILKEDLSGICLACDTHKLKNESYQRLLSNGQTIYCWPSPPKLPMDLQEVLDRRHLLGTGGGLTIYQLALNHPDVIMDSSRVESIQRYLQALSEIHLKSKIICTHEKSYQLQNNKNIHTFIYDEDFVKTLVRIESISLSDIETYKKIIRNGDEPVIKEIIDHLDHILDSAPKKTHYNNLKSYSKEIIQKYLLKVPKSFESPIEALFYCNYFRKDTSDPKAADNVYCISREELNADKKYIVLSATADEEIYKLIFGDRLEFIDLSGTRLKGRLFCHTKRSWSKYSIYTKKDQFIKSVIEAKEKYQFENIITHKFCEKNKYLYDTDIPVVATFGGLQGLNGIDNKPFAIFGTPYPPEYVVKLWAALLNLGLTEAAYEFADRPVIYGDYELNIPILSDNRNLQRIYLWITSSEIIQAVGRARLVSNNIDLHLFSKIPVSNSILI